MAGQAEALALAAVLGSPISHSLSPVLHRAAYAESGLSGWEYRAIECDEASFPTWFAELGPRWQGLSLTMPLKRVVLPLLADSSPLVRIVGAANTVTWDDERRPLGHNTDVHGIVASLESVGAAKPRTACILGSGATACSALAALARLGCPQVRLLARSPARAGQALAVAGRLGLAVGVEDLARLPSEGGADVLINTLPAAAAAELAAALPERGVPGRVLLDVTYHPWPTAMASAWTGAGGVAVGGFEMLLHQAAAQFTLMTGLPAPVLAMRAAGERALTQPPQPSPLTPAPSTEPGEPR